MLELALSEVSEAERAQAGLDIRPKQRRRRKDSNLSDWQSGFAEANQVRTHYTRTGGAKPPVVLAHGVTDDGLCWTPVARALEADYDVIMVDARGHGRSDAPEEGYGPVEQAGDLYGVISALDLRRPAVLGHSMGAATTLVFAGRYPDVPGAILLEDPPAWWVEAQGQAPSSQDRRAGLRTWVASIKRKTREELVAEQRSQTPEWPEAELGPWAEAKLRLSPHVLKLFEQNAADVVDWPETLRSISCPVLLITADPARGAILSQNAVSALQELIPQLQVSHVPDAGHNIRRDQCDRFMDVVRPFLGAWREKAVF